MTITGTMMSTSRVRRKTSDTIGPPEKANEDFAWKLNSRRLPKGHGRNPRKFHHLWLFDFCFTKLIYSNNLSPQIRYTKLIDPSKDGSSSTQIGRQEHDNGKVVLTAKTRQRKSRVTAKLMVITDLGRSQNPAN
ncbi:predicted protein [Arabidopsis lyrata subsp. lyrata]|uniref:Predicted protein n=1 Tax=Arabidopsis lyrata subsp. lyrata TaxID=81972 RepID=D7KZD4_ARALL|nr:predicted protein [Arabidopsis lyrata subsp. lyrata]